MRKWTDVELKNFAIVPVDDGNEFAFALETLTLKKPANVQIFERIKVELDRRLKMPSVLEENRKPLSKIRGKGKGRPIDTS